MTGFATNLWCRTVNRAWQWQSRREARAFARATHCVEETQHAVLRSILADNRDCEYGRANGFESITSFAEFQRRVPTCSYEELASHIERINDGKANVLTCEPVLMVEPTGGSTGGAKWIPYTATLRRQFQRALAVWVDDLFRQIPSAGHGRAYWSISPAAQRPRCTAGGVRIGFEDDTEYLAGWQRWAVSRLLAVPPSVARLRHVENFQYATLKYLLAASDLALASVWSPTFLSQLLLRLRTWWEPLVADLGSGRWSWPHDEASSSINSLPLLRDPQRAQQLANLFGSAGVTAETLAHCWPRLAVVSAWGDAAAANPADDLQRELPHARFQPKGLLATEGVISIPLIGQTGAALALRSHLFEFIPSDVAESIREVPRGAWQLEEGRRYRVLLTTGGGLYRYDIGDEVEVVGFLAACPLVRFRGRATASSDLVGEKLNEQHVRHVLQAACAAEHLDAAGALLVPLTVPTPRYRVLVAYPLWRGSAEEHTRLEQRLAHAIDVALRENPQYAYARDLGQLAPLELQHFTISPTDLWQRYVAVCVARGQRLGDIKPTTLASGAGWEQLTLKGTGVVSS